MPKITVPIENAIPIRRKVGETVTLINFSATDCYIDFDAGRLNATAPGVVPSGSKIASGGGQLQITNLPEPGVIWARAAVQMDLDVQP